MFFHRAKLQTNIVSRFIENFEIASRNAIFFVVDVIFVAITLIIIFTRIDIIIKYKIVKIDSIFEKHIQKNNYHARDRFEFVIFF